MNERNGSMWVRALILGILLIIAMTAVGFSLAQQPGEPAVIDPESGQENPYVVRIPDVYASADGDQLAEMGIVPQPLDGQGGILVHVTAEQLALLQAEGIPFEKQGRVGVIDSESQSGLLGECIMFKNPSRNIPCGGDDAEWVSDHMTNYHCGPLGSTITSVRYHIRYVTDAWTLPETQCLTCDGQIDVQLSNSIRDEALSTHNSACCIPNIWGESEEREPNALYDCFISGTTDAFDGDPVRDTWWLKTKNRCSSCSTYQLLSWTITVYYDDPPTPTPTPTATCGPIGLEITKTLVEPAGRHAIVSDTVRFEITVANTGNTTITSLYLRDHYDPECLRFLSSTIPASSVDAEQGMIDYFDVLDLYGGTIPPGADPIVFYMDFHAEGYCEPAENCMFIVEAQDDCGQTVEFLQDCAEVFIDAVPCTEAITNGGFETGDFTGWVDVATETQLAPLVQSDEVHNGNFAAQLGSCTEFGGDPYMPAGESGIWQVFHVPENVEDAPLTFWYKMVTDDWDVDYDWFTAYYVVGGEGTSVTFTLVPPICQNTGWVKVGPIDLSHLAGFDVRLGFRVHQDGQWGCTSVYVDDVELCGDMVGGGEPNPGPTPEGSCWKQGDYTDYAPNGVPDFDMRQADWQNTSDQWNYDAPAAFANSLWWMDSRFEQELAPTVVPPPEISDHYGLLEAYGAWDDHAEENVQPFVEDLADYLGTDADGTTPADAYGGILDYLKDQDLDDQYTVTWRPEPSLDWIRSEVLRCEDVMLLLGFWENQAGEWKRLGGHWVTAPGVGCEHEPLIGLSDPWFDRAEYGWPGEWRPSFSAHPHPPEPPDTVHNDAAYLSHDLYTVFRSGDGDVLARYAPEYEEIENFFGLNVPPPHEAAQALEYMDGAITTRIEDAIAVSPYTDTVVLRLDPVLNHVLEGSAFEVELMVDSGDQLINAVNVHLNFNRDKLRIVNEAGNPTDEIIPSEAFTFVGIKSADNTNGRIDFEASTTGGPALSGSYSIATLRFKAMDQAYGTAIDIVTSGGRASQLLYGGVIPFLAVDGTVVVSEGATLAGDTTMEGRPQGSRWSVPVHISLDDPATASSVGSYFTETDNAGDFQVGGLDMGTFDVSVKGSHTLRSIVRSRSLSAGSNAVNFGTLLEGDANNDNRVDMLDMSAVQDAYSTSTGDPVFDPNCDFDESGSVDIGDVSLLTVNFAIVGDGESAASLVLSRPSRGLRLERAGTLAAVDDPIVVELDPSSLEAGRGDIFELSLRIDSGTRAVDGVQIYLGFDPEILSVVDAEGNPRGWIRNLGAFDNVIKNKVYNSTGEIDFVASALESAKPSGSFTVASVRFKVLKNTRMTRIRFSAVEPRFTRVAVDGEYPLLRYVASQVNVNMLKLNLPLVFKP